MPRWQKPFMRGLRGVVCEGKGCGAGGGAMCVAEGPARTDVMFVGRSWATRRALLHVLIWRATRTTTGWCLIGSQRTCMAPLSASTVGAEVLLRAGVEWLPSLPPGSLPN